MTRYEIFRTITFPIMPAFLRRVRADLRLLLVKQQRTKPSILDVGGRKSPYTIGLPMCVTLLDIPRENGIQEQLNLGLSSKILESIKVNRSNVNNLILEDMTQTRLLPATFDAVVCVEVIEHVRRDDDFVRNISMVLKPGGWAYFTTPNGDFVKNEGPHYNPDHIRHYKKDELNHLLKRYFDRVDVKYAIKTGKFRMWGIAAYTGRKPLRTVKSIIGNIINHWQSKGLDDMSTGTAHLVAICRKS